MQGRTRRRTGFRSTLRRAGAVTWIDPRRAIVARASGRGDIELREFSLPADADERRYGLGDVARELGGPDPVVFIGPESDRAALEREFVSVFRRPDRIEDIEPSGPMTRADLVAMLRERLGS